MATINICGEAIILSDKRTVSAYLKNSGLIYEFWGVERLNGRLKNSFALSPEDRQTIFDLYESEISDLKIRQGYLTQDIVVLSDKTPNLGSVLRKFHWEHHHTDDEVRFVLDGSGIFTIRRNDSIFEVTLHAGDLLVIPAYTRHWFDLTTERRIQCIRIFKDPAGWAAIYNDPDTSSLLNYIQTV